MTKTILLADDSLTIQKVVELTFADTQYNVVSLSSGEELLEKLSEIGPELVICDIVMPGLEGYDVCQRIKSDPATLHIPVILLSGTFEPFDRDRALAAGCSEIITKPFEAKRLVDAVDTLLNPEAASAEDEPDQEPAELGLEEAAGVGEEAPGEVDFGTQLAAETGDTADAPEGVEQDDGIDFTTSGFAEMEAAGREIEDPEPATVTEQADSVGVGEPDHGLTTGGAFEVAGDEDFADAFSTPSPATDPPQRTADEDRTDPFEADDEPGTTQAAAMAEDDPFADDIDMADDAQQPPPEDRVQDGIREIDATEPDFDLKSAEEAFDIDPRPIAMTDADTAPVPEMPQHDGNAEPATTASEHEPAGSTATDSGFSLSDDDVDRIARRVVELAGDRLEQVAWEVIPDVAEVVVRERIRQLEAEFETEN